VVRVLSIEKDDIIIEQMEELYKSVWNKSIKEPLVRHIKYKGFRGNRIISAEGRLIGFVYGYISLPEQYYHTLLSNELSQEEYDFWLKDCFEVVELVIHPLHRKRGFGSKLMRALLLGVDNKTAVLTTQVTNTAAQSLYTGLGWTVIKNAFILNKTEAPFMIMGKVLGKKNGL
jgi:ribosomal protein S18 acetylase RimI-like enzyme